MSFPMRMACRNGVLVFEDGSEVCLWGNNFQPNLYWEYKFRMEHMGLPADLTTMKRLTDQGFEELSRYRANLIRCHLTPADFADADGKLVQNLWLKLLCYMVAKARENGIYVSLTFINAMEWALIEDSFVVQGDREDWIFRPDFVAKSHNYMRQLLNHVNPYTGIALKDDPVIAVWEPINEPKYPTFEQVQTDEGHRGRFREWAVGAGVGADQASFPDFRHAIVLDYINGVRQLLLDEGAQQPMVWNCNWPRMIKGRERIFDAIAESTADAISFCCYPGQDDLGGPFMESARNMSDRNYLPFLKRCFDEYGMLGWILTDRFAGKAKVVYEFETMYNSESAYLHPAMAKLFRALGAQMATMWTHCFDLYSPYMGCAHNLNVKTTPHKAAGYIISGQVFRRLPRGGAFEMASELNDEFGGFQLSRQSDTAAASFGHTYMVAGGQDWSPLPPPQDTREIVGHGACMIVDYNANGMYFIRIEDDVATVELMPDAVFVREQWQWLADGGLVTRLDHETPHRFRLSLPGHEQIDVELKPGMHKLVLTKE